MMVYLGASGTGIHPIQTSRIYSSMFEKKLHHITKESTGGSKIPFSFLSLSRFETSRRMDHSWQGYRLLTDGKPFPAEVNCAKHINSSKTEAKQYCFHFSIYLLRLEWFL
ncbi:hypothetical protein NPIL_501261 [Nephila pilipes]|uniref:Uncharacterized protein n=1 Tax=Nephila pilipes TaxID=299642 RepID=A0A8X6QK36_NEPPI|nr:hypothetical protein NPIL_501261 [Nephila pilipes]